MSDGWNPISEDGRRLVRPWQSGYRLYVAESVDPADSVRSFRWCGDVPTFEHAAQWLADGELHGEVLEIPVTPKPVKVTRG